ncbi:MAG: hypothetical protein GX616_00575 [Planctomycetes bacterium]|nr:hypothetical protein [Planctomycetota bacterium]
MKNGRLIMEDGVLCYQDECPCVPCECCEDNEVPETYSVILDGVADNPSWGCYQCNELFNASEWVVERWIPYEGAGCYWKSGCRLLELCDPPRDPIPVAVTVRLTCQAESSPGAGNGWVKIWVTVGYYSDVDCEYPVDPMASGSRTITGSGKIDCYTEMEGVVELNNGLANFCNFADATATIVMP